LGKHRQSYLSNQCPRTFAPKPAYSVRFWQARGLEAPLVDIVDVIATRAKRFLSPALPSVRSQIVHGDSRLKETFKSRRFKWAITSPPYYGMRTYIPDQWLRNWLVGGPPAVPYTPPTPELSHNSAADFVAGLNKVWTNLANHAADDARLVIRFGGIADRDVDPIDIMKESLYQSGWRLMTIVSAGDANDGRRQATQFAHDGPAPKQEFDFYARAAS
jgi:hypothetical protein